MSKPDDLEAVRTVADALAPFDKAEQERILRWVRERIGLVAAPESTNAPSRQEVAAARSDGTGRQGTDLKSFAAEKGAASDNQFAAVVAYYFQFEAPEDQRKDSINSTDLQDACRVAGRRRLGDPGKTLRNAHDVGLLDKAGDRGAYRINAVGENLVAMTLPGGGESATRTAKRARKPRKVGAKTGVKAKTLAKAGTTRNRPRRKQTKNA